MFKKYYGILIPAFCLSLFVMTPSAAAQEFNGPLFGLATAPNGDILVADASSGIVVLNGKANPHIALPGITDVSPIGQGSMWAVRGGAPIPTIDSGQALLRVSSGKTRTIVNLFDFERDHNPDGFAIDSNPFDVQSLGGGSALVADAGGNDLLRIDNQGNVEVLAVLPLEVVSTQNFRDLTGCVDPMCLPPAIPAQPVATSVAVGPDGYYYVGELKGFPAPVNESRIWRVSPNATGGTINACDIYTLVCTEVATGIPELTAITFGKRGTLWATENSLIPGEATVIEVP